MADLIRASSLAHVPELITAHGGDAEKLLGEAGVAPTAIGDYNQFVTYTALARVVGRAADDLRVPDFGLRLSRLQNLEILGPIAVLARNSETLESALLGISKYLHTYSPAIRAELHSRARESAFEFVPSVRRLPSRAQVVELSLGVILGMFHLLLDPEFRPIRITFRHSPVSAEDVYIDYFQCPVHFDADANSLVFPTGLLDRHLAGGDNQAYALATRYLGDQHRHLNMDQHVVELITKLMPLGQGTLNDVARILMMHPRVLQRRLAEADTSFEKLLDEVRRSTASELLATAGLPLSTVAGHLGYSEQSSLTRSCRRWFGEAPLAVRRRLLNREARPKQL